MTEKSVYVTPKAQVAFANLLQPKAVEKDNGSTVLEYSCVLIFDQAAQQTEAFKKLQEAAQRAAKDKWGNNVPSNLRNPFRKSEEKADKGYPPNCLFINLRSKNKPEVVDATGQDIIDSSMIYSGMFGRASVTCYAYDQKGNRGVSFGLNNFQKLGEGEPMGSKTRASDDFGTVSGEDATADVDAMFNA